MDFRSGLKRSVSDPGVQSENSQKSKKSNLNLIHAVPSDKVLNSNIPPDICNHDVKLVNKKFSVNGTHQTVVEMKESTKLFQRHNSIGLWEDFSRNGYILLRGVLDRDAILQANLDIRKRLVKMCLVDQSDSLTALSSSGYTVEMASGFLVCKGLGGNPSPEDHARQGAWRDLCHSSTVQVLYVFLHQSLPAQYFTYRILQILQSILNNEIVDIILLLLADGKSQCEDPGYQVRKFGQEKAWLRVKAAHEFTPEHADIYHFRVRVCPTVDCCELAHIIFVYNRSAPNFMSNPILPLQQLSRLTMLPLQIIHYLHHRRASKALFTKELMLGLIIQLKQLIQLPS